ncbi:hypothetical protein ACROYT_G014820 [Oculina patagonica]
MERPDVTSLLTKAQLLVLMDYVLSNPTSYYKEMQSYLAEAKGNSPDFVGIHCILKCSGYSRKRQKSNWQEVFKRFLRKEIVTILQPYNHNFVVIMGTACRLKVQRHLIPQFKSLDEAEEFYKTDYFEGQELSTVSSTPAKESVCVNSKLIILFITNFPPVIV